MIFIHILSVTAGIRSIISGSKTDLRENRIKGWFTVRSDEILKRWTYLTFMSSFLRNFFKIFKTFSFVLHPFHGQDVQAILFWSNQTKKKTAGDVKSTKFFGPLKCCSIFAFNDVKNKSSRWWTLRRHQSSKKSNLAQKKVETVSNTELCCMLAKCNRFMFFDELKSELHNSSSSKNKSVWLENDKQRLKRIEILQPKMRLQVNVPHFLNVVSS